MTAERRTRQDRSRAATVEEGLKMMERCGRAPAAKFLLDEGVPFRVIVRVLGEPTKRR